MAKLRGRTPKQPPTIASIVSQYMRDVERVVIPSGEFLRLAVKRHQQDLVHGKERGLSFDTKKAEKAVQWFSYLKHSKGEWAGKRFTLEPWQVFLIWVLFGWIRADGTRRSYRSFSTLSRVATRKSKTRARAETGARNELSCAP